MKLENEWLSKLSGKGCAGQERIGTHKMCIPCSVLSLFLIAWLLMPSVAQAQWVLVYSAEDQVCQHMLQRVNADIQQNGDVDPSRFPEVQAIQWSSENQILGPYGKELLTDTSAQNRLAIFDVNNDGVDEIARIWEARNWGGGGDYKPFFDYYPVGLEEQIYRTKITSIDLASQRLNDSIYSNEGAENYNGSILELINIPIQSTAISGGYSRPRYVYFGARDAEIFPMIYREKFYVSMARPNLAGGAYTKYVIREYDIENRVSDVCYLLNIGL